MNEDQFAGGSTEVTLQINESGEQIVMIHPAGISMGLIREDDPSATSLTIDAAKIDADKLIDLAVTNDISAAMLRDIEKKTTE